MPNRLISDLVGIATLLISLAFISMMVVRSKDTKAVAIGVSKAFADLLNTATLSGAPNRGF